MITTTKFKERYIGNGSTIRFDFDFKILSETHLLLLIENASHEILPELILNTDFTISGVGNDSGYIELSTPLPQNNILIIKRNIPIKQPTDFENQGGFFPETHEDALDLITMIAQQLQEENDRAVKIPETGNESLTFPAKELRKNTVLGFGGDGSIKLTPQAFDSASIALTAKTETLEAKNVTLIARDEVVSINQGFENSIASIAKSITDMQLIIIKQHPLA
jgi:hypothetical protein